MEQRYREIAPHPSLRGFVACYWMSQGSSHGTQLVLPDGCADVIVERGSGKAARVVGTMRAAVLVERRPTRDLVAIRFAPGGAHALLKLPMEALVDAVVPLADLVTVRAEHADVWQHADGAAARHAFDAFLASQLPRATVDEQRALMWAKLCMSESRRRIADLADACGTTRQHLRRVVHRATGIGPKLLGRIGRLRSATDAIASGRRADACLAQDIGFFDQAHMVNEFRALAHTTPGGYAAIRQTGLQSGERLQGG